MVISIENSVQKACRFLMVMWSSKKIIGPKDKEATLKFLDFPHLI